MDAASPTAIRVATLNVRNTADRWSDRRHLVAEQMADLNPAVAGLQEVRRWPSQARWIAERASAAGGRRYRRLTAWKTGYLGLWEGIAILSRLGVVEWESLVLGSDSRVAMRARLTVPGGGTLDLYNVHLSWRGETARLSQVHRLLAWMQRRDNVAQVLIGDFNAGPTSATVAAVTDAGLRSAYAARHGREPAGTVPTPLTGGIGVEPRRVIDHIFVNDHLDVLDASVVFDRPHPSDAGLFPSDHYGLAADLSIRV